MTTRRRTGLGPPEVIVGILLLMCSTPAPAQELDPEDEQVFSLSGDSLPLGVRYATFTSHFVLRIKEKSPSVGMLLEETGLAKLDPATVERLAAFYGDFRERQQARSERLIAASGSYSGEEADAFEFERAEFLGGILGRWLAQVRREGHDPGPFVRRVLQRSSSVFFGGDIPPYEKLEKEGQLFESAFEREFGAPLQSLIASGEEARR